jgi:pilus assembly protein Flp/PilA
MNFLIDLILSEDGPTAVEYAVLLALILVMVIAAIVTVGQGTGGLWSNNSQQLDTYM